MLHKTHYYSSLVSVLIITQTQPTYYLYIHFCLIFNFLSNRDGSMTDEGHPNHKNSSLTKN